jgi:hypothetical protein
MGANERWPRRRIGYYCISKESASLHNGVAIREASRRFADECKAGNNLTFQAYSANIW